MTCGLRTVLVRSLLRRDRFSTPRAMRTFLLNEPDVTERLLDLQGAGWIAYDGRVDSRDYWRATEKAHRLTATKIIGRISAGRGAVILNQLIEVARSINSEPERSQRIEAMFLFGSLLTGSEDGTVGDVDVVVQFRPRALPRSVRDALLDAEVGDGSYGLGRWSRGISIIRSRLRAVSRSVSIHDDADLRLPGVRYKQVYAFDVSTDAETSFDPAERHHPEPFGIEDLAAAPAPNVFRRQHRSWPAPPPSSLIEIDRFRGYLAQHLWQNGVSIAEIADVITADATSVEAYLSVCVRPVSMPAMITASLSKTLEGIVPPDAGYWLSAAVRIEPDASYLVVHATDRESYERIGRAWCRKGNGVSLQNVRYDLVPVLITVTDALRQWRDKIRPRLGGLHLEATAYLPVTETDAPTLTSVYDFRPFAAPMMSALDAAWAHPRGSAYDIALEVELQDAARSKIRLRRGNGFPPQYERMPKEITKPLNDVLRPLRVKWASALDGQARLVLSVRGTAIQDE